MLLSGRCGAEGVLGGWMGELEKGIGILKLEEGLMLNFLDIIPRWFYLYRDILRKIYSPLSGRGGNSLDVSLHRLGLPLK